MEIYKCLDRLSIVENLIKLRIVDNPIDTELFKLFRQAALT